jgi:hypothetical protein
MRRHDPLKLFDRDDTGDLDQVYVQIRDWARTVKLDPIPQMPPELRGRVTDNWRPLIAIADSFGAEIGRIARAAAVAFAQEYRDEDWVVILLHDIRKVFDARGIDRIHGKTLLAALHELEDADWSEFAGFRSDHHAPHKLRMSELRAMLRSVGIFTHSVWPQKGQTGDRSGKGYYRSDFEAAWEAYCREEESGKPANIAALRAS